MEVYVHISILCLYNCWFLYVYVCVFFLNNNNCSVPGFSCFARVSKQRLREARIQLADYLMLLLAGACLGTLAKVNDETFGSLGYTFTVIAICELPVVK